ncbi:Nitrogen regulatory protein P-II [Candidatus Methylobacter favarea]|uniref:Nitrogen regulatory protein P-II n=1 Tax=Candidatus Methylobacter favarea TaxID=2707345 RepID=A0A8S0YAE8_9GAMM|nr:P-II family nitrogen regulator [Candidatus Methylobacter favarea]CAA9891735.1 Nitrogen regulatory protein P-II [Candidatus Methylobacter favarea]
MKEIRAYIQPFMLSKLTQTLLEIPNFPGMSVSDCEGFGRAKVIDKQDYTPFVPKKRIEIFAPDELVESIFDAVMTIANTHQHGAGKVFVINVDEGGRICTGERGNELA